MKLTFRKSWARNLLMWSDLTLGPLLQCLTRMAKLKSAHHLLIIAPRGLNFDGNGKCHLSQKL